jgi:hypothetical protein
MGMSEQVVFLTINGVHVGLIIVAWLAWRTWGSRRV